VEILLKKIVQVAGGKLSGDDSIKITGVNSLNDAESGEISFFSDRRYKDSLANTKASAVLISEINPDFKGSQVLVSDPALAYAKVAGLFASPVPKHNGISELSVIHDSVLIGKNVSVYPNVYIGAECSILDDCVLFPGVFLGDRVKIGKNTVIYPNVTILQDCLIGNNVIIHAGTVIGSDGFGFVRDGVTSVKVPQLGIVQIDDNVEIGANNCIDRAALGKTWIMSGVKTDNLVQIAHNVVIGENTLIVAQAGVSGSVHIGREVIIGGQVGISDHLQIGDRAMIGSQSGVAKSIGPGEIVSGCPTMPHRLWLKNSGLIMRLPQLNERLRNCEKYIEKLQKKLS